MVVEWGVNGDLMTDLKVDGSPSCHHGSFKSRSHGAPWIGTGPWQDLPLGKALKPPGIQQRNFAHL